MINASLSAGLINNNTDLSQFLVLEPVVSSIYFNSSGLYFDKTFNEGKPYIICIIGEKTLDLYTYRNRNNSNNQTEFIEVYQPLGGNYGLDYINEEFIKRLIVEIFGEQKINDIKEKADEDWDKFKNDIEKLKKYADSYGNLLENKELDCRLFGYDSGKSLDDYIKDYNQKNHKYKYEIKKSQNRNYNWELLIPNKIFLNVYEEISYKIFLFIEEIYNDIHTGHILFLGTVSPINIIVNFLYDFAKEKKMDISIVVSEAPEKSISFGAVLFGLDNYVIKKRKEQFTALSKWYSY